MFHYQNDLEFARQMDEKDPLARFRDEFIFPQHNGSNALYFCGNSLGLQPKGVKKFLERELNNWAEHAVEGHFKIDDPWLTYHERLKESSATLVGALPSEVVVMNSLTVNLHLLMVSFYRPTKKRFKIICEYGAFPSDQYAFESQVKFHGFEPDEAIIELKARKGELFIRTEDILATIEENKDSLALILMGGVNYYTGQVFDMETITKAGHDVGAIVGFDLAHAAGNVKLELHNWDVDFAAWCTYKYLNSGPGGIAAAFVHERHARSTDLPRFAGWFGNEVGTRFQMKKGFIPAYGADGWQMSNSPIMLMAPLRASLVLFDESGMDKRIEKRDLLTGYLEFVLLDIQKHLGKEYYKLMSSTKEPFRGSQLSVIIKENGRKVFEQLSHNGVIADWREPEVIRFAPVPLYNSFEDVYQLGVILKSFFN